MTGLVWSSAGDRLYETGVDRGVLYVGSQPGVAWNGLTAVTESPSGGESSPQYADNKKYLNLVSDESFGGTIEAFHYPHAFKQCDGTSSPLFGLSIGQQVRKTFNLCYRTRIGNDLKGTDFGYKLHLIYNALASPSEKAYATLNDSPEPISFSWEFSTSPVKGAAFSRPTAHMVIDSTKVSALLLQSIEQILYGTDTTAPTFIMPDDIANLLLNIPVVLEVVPDIVGGVATLKENGKPDMISGISEGIFVAPVGTRLVESNVPGTYTLEV